jgi:hypothetical protein
MYAPTHSSPRLEFRPKRIKVEDAIMDANRLVYEGKYTAALSAYDKLLEQRCHPVYYLNRALCFIATHQPHLAVNDALRAYMMAQCVIDAIRNKGECNDHIRKIDAHIITYNGTSRLFVDTALIRYLRDNLPFIAGLWDQTMICSEPYKNFIKPQANFMVQMIVLMLYHEKRNGAQHSQQCFMTNIKTSSSQEWRLLRIS